MFFGELALLTNMPHNATAKIIEDSVLLILRKEQLETLIKSHPSAAESFLTIAMERYRPMHSSDVEHYHRTNADGEKIVILKNKRLKQYYQLSPIGWFIWQQVDGTQTIEDITLKVLNNFEIFSPDIVVNTILDLMESEFITFPMPHLLTPTSSRIINTTWLSSIKRKLKSLFFIRITFNDIDSEITKTYNAGIRFLFTFTAKCIFSIIIALGLFLFVVKAQESILFIPSLSHLLIILISVYILHYLFSIIHELGHAYAVKYFGREVHHAGMIFYWLGLFSFVDVSDMWLSDRKSHAMVSLAGPFTDLLLAGIASIFAWFIPLSAIQIAFWMLALLFYYSVLTNLNPIHEVDGYHALSNLLNKPALRKNAVLLFSKKNINSLFTLNFIKQHRAELIYWGLCIVFLILFLVIAFIAQYYLRLLLPETLLGISTYHLFWCLPLLVTSKFIFNLIQQHKNYYNAQ